MESAHAFIKDFFCTRTFLSLCQLVLAIAWIIITITFANLVELADSLFETHIVGAWLKEISQCCLRPLASPALFKLKTDIVMTVVFVFCLGKGMILHVGFRRFKKRYRLCLCLCLELARFGSLAIYLHEKQLRTCEAFLEWHLYIYIIPLSR